MSGRTAGGRQGPSYGDDELARAVAASNSWRGVLRHLGIRGTSSIRGARHHADRLGLNYSHFTGGRRWTDPELAEAVAVSHSWSEVARTLGLVGGSSVAALQGHAARLGLDAGHFCAAPDPGPQDATWPVADRAHLARAGSFASATWFALRGWDVAWPLEPCRYDLLVTRGAVVLRIQVKTTTTRSGNTWTVWLSKSRKVRVTYGPDEIDYFFIIDGDFHPYVIPVAVVGGLHAINLSAYAAYRVTGVPGT